MADAKDLYVGCPVRVVRPRYTQGGRSCFQDKQGRLKSLSGRFCVIRIDGEDYGFFTEEVDTILDS